MKTVSGLLSTAAVAMAMALVLVLAPSAQAGPLCDRELTSIRMELDHSQAGTGKSMASRTLQQAEKAGARGDERACMRTVARAKHQLHRYAWN